MFCGQFLAYNVHIDWCYASSSLRGSTSSVWIIYSFLVVRIAFYMWDGGCGINCKIKNAIRTWFYVSRSIEYFVYRKHRLPAFCLQDISFQDSWFVILKETECKDWGIQRKKLQKVKWSKTGKYSICPPCRGSKSKYTWKHQQMLCLYYFYHSWDRVIKNKTHTVCISWFTIKGDFFKNISKFWPLLPETWRDKLGLKWAVTVDL